MPYYFAQQTFHHTEYSLVKADDEEDAIEQVNSGEAYIYNTKSRGNDGETDVEEISEEEALTFAKEENIDLSMFDEESISPSP